MKAISFRMNNKTKPYQLSHTHAIVIIIWTLHFMQFPPPDRRTRSYLAPAGPMIVPLKRQHIKQAPNANQTCLPIHHQHESASLYHKGARLWLTNTTRTDTHALLQTNKRWRSISRHTLRLTERWSWCCALAGVHHSPHSSVRPQRTLSWPSFHTRQYAST